MSIPMVTGFRLSPPQQHLWRQHGERVGPYRVCAVVSIAGPIDPGDLRLAMRAVVRRHESLRTLYRLMPGMTEPVQVIESESPWSLDVDDLPRDPLEARAAIDAAMRSLADGDVHVDRGPVWRARLLRRSPSSATLLLMWPAIVADVASVGRVVHDLAHVMATGPDRVTDSSSTDANAGANADADADDEPMQHVDVTEWQHELLASDGTAAGRDFWRQLDRETIAASRLSLRRRQPRDGAFVPRTLDTTLPDDLGARVTSWAEAHDAAEAEVLSAAWLLLMWRLTESDPLVSGLSADARSLEDLASVVGPIGRIVPVRCRIDDRWLPADLVAHVRTARADHLRWQSLFAWPLLDDSRHAEVEPFCPLVFGTCDWQPVRADAERTWTIERVDACIDRVELMAIATRTARAWRVCWTYDDQVHTADQVACIADQYLAVLRRFTATATAAAAGTSAGAATAAIARAPMLADIDVRGEREHTPARARGRFVHHLFRERAVQEPGREAIVCIADRGDRLTYGELKAKAEQLAGFLRAQGAGPEARIGVLLDHSCDLLVTVLAVLQAGAAFVPLPPGYPIARLAAMADQAGASFVITHRQLADLWPPTSATRVVRLDLNPDARAIAAAVPLAIPVPVDDATLAYVIFTSGSTGEPKGVMVPHGALAHYVRWSRAAYVRDSNADADVRLHGSIGFDATLTSMFVPLCAGARVVVASATENVDAFATAASGVAGQPSSATNQAFLKITPAHLALVTGSVPPDRLAALTETLVIGGEALSGEQLAAWQAHAPATRIVNEYGPTEATVGCLVHDTRAADLEPGPLPIGHPIPGVTCHALDRYGRAAAVGVTGELYLGGAQIARGYDGRPDLTAERFCPDPFASAPGARCYRTGDLVHVRPDGSLEYVGRRDQQVKIRGHRVELGEVEAAIRQQPGLQDAVAMVREDTPGDRRLVAYVVAPPDVAVASDRLQQALQATLPDYMVPAVIVRLDALPVTANGKVDRRGLPAPDGLRPTLARAYVAPTTHAEAMLARIWAEVLGVDRVGIHDNFFALGGDSILSLQIVARAGRAGLRLAPRLVFEHQTIAALAAAATPAHAAALEQGPVEGRMPLMPIQHWFFDQAFADPHHYNQALALDITSPMAPRALDTVWRRLQRHHDALRLRYRRDAHGWHAIHAAPDEVQAAIVIDAGRVAAGHRRRVWDRIARDCQRSLDLGQGPIARAAIVQWDAERPLRLLLVLHHIVCDGLSWRVLLDDLGELCRGGDLPPKTTSFKAWADALTASVSAGAFDADLPAWQAMSEPGARVPYDRDLAGVVRLDKDIDAWDIATNTVASQRTCVVTFGVGETEALLSRLPVSLDVHIQEALLAGVVDALARWTGERAWRIDLESHGRESLGEPHDVEDVSRTIGWFTCVYPVRVAASRGDDPTPTLRDVRAAVRRVPRYGIGYGPLRYLRDDAGIAPLRAASSPEIIVNYWGQLDPVLVASGPIRPALDPVGPLRSPRQRRSHVFEISASVIEARLKVAWTYSANLQTADTIDRLVSDLRRVITRLSELSGDARAQLQTPADFPLADVTQAQLDQLVAEGGAVADLYPLSPLQDGLLFHWLYETDRAVYLQQFAARVTGPLDVEAFQHAWVATVARHDILRTGFVWERRKRPLQVVRERARLPWTSVDWRELDAETQAAQLANRLDADRQQGLSIEQPPLMRVALTRLADDSWHVLWTSHHLILDGWSMPIVIRDVLTAYAALREGREPWTEPPAGRFADYIAWLQRQDGPRAEAFWSRTLDGFTAPTLLATPPIVADAPEVGVRDTLRSQLPASLVDALQQLSRTHGITMNTWFAGAWGLMVAYRTRRDDVVFGTVASGRPADLPGIEQTPGLFVNSLPLRLHVAAGLPAIAWFAECQRRQVEARDYEYTSLVRIQEWSAIPAGTPLFDNLFVYENYPSEQAWRQQDNALRIERGRASARTSFPIEVEIAGAGAEMVITLAIDVARTPAALAHFLRDGFGALLARLTAAPGLTVGALTESLDELARGADTSEIHHLRSARQASLRALRRTAAGTAPHTPQLMP
jgi:amino acid adenylation domain-containing protein/non-ribosomal peptide synthase protein (TIGR01720 family)